MPSLVIEPVRREVVVAVRDLIVARSRNAVMVREAGHAGVVYVPRSDADMTRLARSNHTSQCPLKGLATYFSIWTDQGSIANAAWSYDMPLADATEVAGYLAFDGQKVEIMIGTHG